MPNPNQYDIFHIPVSEGQASFLFGEKEVQKGSKSSSLLLFFIKVINCRISHFLNDLRVNCGGIILREYRFICVNLT